jgi:type VI secretion system protein ImpF
MAEHASRERLQPSLLDRLTDPAPEQGRESFEQQTLGMQQLRQAVLRDLAWLLNTTSMAASVDLSATPLARASAINFGVPGLAGAIGTTGRLSAIEAGITEAIRAFEPRIRPETLRVRLRPTDDGRPTPALVFEIRGELWAQPVPQQLFLETAIELETRMAVVTDARGGTR